MATKITDLIEAIRRRKAEDQGMIPGARGPRNFEEAGVPLPDTSTWKGVEDTQEAVEPPTERAERSSRGRFGAALTGAAAGIRASVGPTAPGQEWRKGLLGGIVGVGVNESAMAREEQLRAAKEAESEKGINALLLKDYLKETPEEAATKARLKAEATLPSKLAAIEANSATRLAFEAAKSEKKGDMTDAQLVEMNDKAWDNALKRFPYGNTEQLSAEYILQKRDLLSKFKLPTNPKLP